MTLPRYSETIRWSLWIWFFFIFLLGSLSVAVWAALGTLSAISVSILECAALLSFYFKSALKLKVDGGWLYAGKAKIEIRFVGKVEELSGETLRKVRGPLADPAAFLSIRFWVTQGVKISIEDSRDSTPYWLISTRHPAKLAMALQDGEN